MLKPEYLLVSVFGALAQLGARYIRIVEATGSNPVCSISEITAGKIFFVTTEIKKEYLKKILSTYIRHLVVRCAACVAEIAQSVEHFTRNEGVVGSSPIFSFPY